MSELLDVAVLGDAVKLIVCGGEVDRSTVDVLTSAIDRAFQDWPTAVQLDLTGVSFFSSDGIHALIGLKHRCESANVLLIVHPSDPVRRVLDTVGMPGILEPLMR